MPSVELEETWTAASFLKAVSGSVTDSVAGSRQPPIHDTCTLAATDAGLFETRWELPIRAIGTAVPFVVTKPFSHL